MNMEKKFARTHKLMATGVGMAALTIGGGTACAGAFASPQTAANQEKQAVTMQGKFYCNITALLPAERARHKHLTDKLISLRKEVVETDKGYSSTALQRFRLRSWRSGLAQRESAARFL